MKIAQSVIGLVVYVIGIILILDVPMTMLTAPSTVAVFGGVLILAILAWITYLVGYQLLYKNIILELDKE